MMDLVDAYKEIGILGFVLVGFAALAFHTAYILRLIVLRKLNGHAKETGEAALINACPYNPAESEAQHKMQDHVKELVRRQRAHQSMMDRGEFNCRWSEKEVHDLIVEMRLLRQALESQRGRLQ